MARGWVQKSPEWRGCKDGKRPGGNAGFRFWFAATGYTRKKGNRKEELARDSDCEST